MRQVEGAFSLVALTSKKMIGCRDPLGIRPLVLGDLDGAWILASETCALDIIGARFVRDLKPGEMVVVTGQGHREPASRSSRRNRASASSNMSISRGRIPRSKAATSTTCASASARSSRIESPVEADIVVPVPDSGTPAAIGFAQQAGIPFELGIIRNHYVGRTFIQPGDSIRHMGVKLKHNANRRMIEGKRVVLVDDSIVRGTTSQKIVQMVRDAGAKEVHMRIASPPTMSSCFYGVDTPEKSKLLASRMSVEEMARVHPRRFAGLPVDRRALPRGRRSRAATTTQPQFCDACFTAQYPTRLADIEGSDNVRTLSLLATGGQ